MKTIGGVMTSRQRIMAALRGEEVDYVPCYASFNQLPGTQRRGHQWNFSWPPAVTPQEKLQFCRVTEEDLDVSFVPGDDQCEEFDSYGPGGHPRIADRDYSLAKEEPPLAVDPWLMPK